MNEAEAETLAMIDCDPDTSIEFKHVAFKPERVFISMEAGPPSDWVINDIQIGLYRGDDVFFRHAATCAKHQIPVDSDRAMTLLKRARQARNRRLAGGVLQSGAR